MDTIDEALAVADHTWRAYGVRRADRIALLADLRQDLASAAADGVGPTQLLGTDVPGFARRLADEAGVHREPPELPRLVGTALIGALLGAAVGLFLLVLLYPLAERLFDLPRGAVPLQVAVAVYYGVPAALVVVGAVSTVRLRLRELAHVRETAKAMALLLPLAGILVTPLTMMFAWATGYSTWAPVVVAEMLLVAGALAGATLLARRWALREPRKQATAATA